MAYIFIVKYSVLFGLFNFGLGLGLLNLASASTSASSVWPRLTSLPVSSIRLCRPSHAPSAVAHVVRPWRECHKLVYVVAQRPNTSSHRDIQFGAIGSRLWSHARFGPWTDLDSPVHCRPVAARQTSSSHATCVCR